MIGKLFHRRFFTMDKKRSLASGNAAAPGEQLPLVGVGGESINRVDSTADRNLFTE